MRIISNNHDYYDSLQSYDDDLIYLRNEVQEYITEDLPRLYLDRFYYFRNKCHKDIPYFVSFFIGFCGKSYPGIHFREHHSYSPEHPAGFTIKESHCYSIEDVDKAIEQRVSKKVFRSWMDDKKSQRDEIATFLAKEYRELDHLFTSPIFKLVPSGSKKYRGKQEFRITWNTSLKEAEFFRILDPWQTYQELNMWIGNQASPEKEIPKVSDRDMRDIKGFDKYSFKKPKEM